ncbi:acetyl/propionyl-CoA carboxylase subuit alpha [Aureimonas endophytica]|uniref:Acetyl/propionyl-CoA carboxylase subuit alpha n=1 Tax=Aureimonas endophytica TaxID=2027858 RepID=A0A916ZHB2_9HYPH|nr:acetyl/propionyl/methylcrotonyl-CoA carboxylase subunit alpha [Aureimonas endophytica]GGD97963.1 acetyl/propionyl-CoA carboxylase subuit alpha [Aureimonas endophytica]
MPLFSKLLIANRGEIACRIRRTAKRLGIATVAVYSDADRNALHVREADESLRIGPAPSGQSYLSIPAILDAVAHSGADAVHPGYGFLSERAEFAEALEDAGIAFVGPPPAAIRAMGDKIASKRLAASAGVSTVPGHIDIVEDEGQAARIAAAIGFPVMIKASAGGGGKGMRIAWTEAEAREGFRASRNEARGAFGDERLFIEKFIEEPRHIEIQVLGDRHGHLVHLGERECSIQRRNQKVIEEAPSPFLDAETRAAMGAEAVALAKAVGYHSAGTVEFIVDRDRRFYFLEMNTRLQVEHPVTELVTGLDLVEAMIRVAAGEPLALRQDDVRLSGWAIESRLYAEDPYRNFLPSIGRLTRYRPPAEGARPDGTLIRNDSGVAEGGEVSVHYDPMLAKLCAFGPDRPQAIAAMAEALDGFEVEGIGHNLPFLAAVMGSERFRAGRLSTAFIAEEFPDGFAGVAPGAEERLRLAAVAVFARHAIETRAAAISGTIDNHRRLIGRAFVVQGGGASLPVALEPAPRGFQLDFGPAGRLAIAGDWLPGRRQGVFEIAGETLTVKIDRAGSGFRLRWRGIDLNLHVREPHVAALTRHLRPKVKPDTSRLLLCPMPGILTALAVSEGDAVEEGQAVATVEAMKMENVLRTERQGVVKRVAVKAGDSLAADDLILELA